MATIDNVIIANLLVILLLVMVSLLVMIKFVLDTILCYSLSDTITSSLCHHYETKGVN